MKKIVILQQYLSPYRVPLFNSIDSEDDIQLFLLYYGKKEERRKWKQYPEIMFSEIQSKCISFKINYEINFNLPYTLLCDLNIIVPDIIICAPDIGGIVSYLYCSTQKCSFVIWSEATLFTENNISILKALLRKIIYSKVKGFLVPGILSKQYIESVIKAPVFYFASNTIDEARFRIPLEYVKKKCDINKITFTFCGSLIERKGILYLLRAFSSFIESDKDYRARCTLRILGTGPLNLSKYQHPNIRYEGFCEGEKYVNFIKDSTAFVLPSLHDNNPLTVVEGLFTGNIIIVSDKVGNYPEAVDDNGYVVKAGSVSALVNVFEVVCRLSHDELIYKACRSIDIACKFSIESSKYGFVSAIRSYKK